MSTIYLPSDYVGSTCKVINNGYIRAYTNNSLTNYVDIYINQDYMVKEGTTFNGYNGLCDNINTYTDNMWYRLDIDKIVITFGFLLSFFIFFCLGFYKALFKGPRRL